MSAVTHSSAFLSAKARVAPGAAKVRAAAAARPAARRAFVVRAADKKKGTSRRYFSRRQSVWTARARRRSRRSRGPGRVPRLDAIGRLAFRLRPRARAPGVAPDPPPVGSIESCSLLTASLF
jgi:hypothetical protein